MCISLWTYLHVYAQSTPVLTKMASVHEDQLHLVFEICDVTNTGNVSLSHLLRLANQHLVGPDYSDLFKKIENLRLKSDVITYVEFRDLFTSFASASENGGNIRQESQTNSMVVVSIKGDTYCQHQRSPNSHSSDKTSPLLLQIPQYYNCDNPVVDVGFSIDTRMPMDDRVSPTSEFDSAIGTSTASPGSGRKLNSCCSSMSDREEENFASFGEANDVECNSDTTLPRIGNEGDTCDEPHSLPPSNFGHRNSWVRRSLRCSPSSKQEVGISPKRWGSFRHAPKRVGGTAVASHLYHSPSFSSGRTSSEQEDMYSDVSLEDDMLDLNHKVQMLQQQVGVLAENQVNSDDRYSRIKQDNSALQARVMMLEEQLRDSELRSEDRLAEEQRRNKELITRVEREKQLTVENYSIRQTNLENEKSYLNNENSRLKTQLEKLLKEKSFLEGRVIESESSAAVLSQENAKISEISKREKEELKNERERSCQVIEELKCEVERLRALEESLSRRSTVEIPTHNNAELEAELKTLRKDNSHLSEQVEDLQAQLLTSRLEEGRTLVSATNNSLAAEFEQMNSDEDALNRDEIDKLRKSLKDSQEANHHLRSYIDDILLAIVENYPQLLEVKQK